MTNAHVVEGAQRIRVILPRPASDSPQGLQSVHAGQILEATLLGTHKQTDLALLKIEATDLHAVSLRSDVRVRQGELVFAMGSPEGLRNSVSMGVVSSVARQLESDDPMVYIQTDAALNPGNSGGPLVDIDGNVVGINTLKLSESGSEGLGFAIPAALVNFDYRNLRKYGHVQRVAIGAKTQNITPRLAAGLGLARGWGVVISDTLPEGAAEAAGLQIGDIVLAIDDHPIPSLPDFITALYLHPIDQVLKIDVIRGTSTSQMSFNVPVKVYHENIDALADVPDLQRTLIPKLSIFVTDLDDRVKPLLSSNRSDFGVVVVAQTAGPNADAGLQTGDIVRAIDRTRLQSTSQFQAIVRDVRSGDPVVLQIERGGTFRYLAFEMD